MQITNNSPSAGYITWTGVAIKYRDVTYSIADGNSNKLFLWWDFTSPTVLQESDTMPTLEDTDSIIFLNDGGTYHIVGIRSRQVHGDVILAGTIPGTALEDTYVKTTTAQDVGGVKTFTDFPVLPSDNPTQNSEAAHKKYVDDHVGASDHGALAGLSDDDHSQYHNDTRGDARYKQIGDAPTAHKVSHQAGGSDNIKIDNLDVADDNTDLDASNSAHGLMKKFTDEEGKYFDASGNFVKPKIDDLTEGDDNTDLDSSSSRHGLLKKLTNEADKFLDASGNWSTGGGGVTDHGALTGLADDDHTIYVLRNILTTNGDIFVLASDGGIVRLALGNNTDVLTANNAKDPPIEWVAAGAPGAHHVSHEKGGADMIRLDDLNDPENNTDLDASNSTHGLMRKFTDEADKWFDASGNYTTPKIIGQFIFTVPDALTTGANKTLELFAAAVLTLTEVYISVKTAPTDASLIIDVNKNGTTIFTTQGGRPTITTGNTSDTSDEPDVTALAKNDKLTIDIDQIGSSVAGSDLTVHVRFEQEVT